MAKKEFAFMFILGCAVTLLVTFLFGCESGENSVLEEAEALSGPPSRSKILEEDAECQTALDCPDYQRQTCAYNQCKYVDVIAAPLRLQDGNATLDISMKGSIIESDIRWFYLESVGGSVLTIEWRNGRPSVHLTLKEFVMTGSVSEEYEGVDPQYKEIAPNVGHISVWLQDTETGDRLPCIIRYIEQ